MKQTVGRVNVLGQGHATLDLHAQISESLYLLSWVSIQGFKKKKKKSSGIRCSSASTTQLLAYEQSSLVDSYIWTFLKYAQLNHFAEDVAELIQVNMTCISSR